MDFDYPLSFTEKFGNIILRFCRGVGYFSINLYLMCKIDFSRYIKDGISGMPGEPGPKGLMGPAGKSAYEIWLEDGNTGTIKDFLGSLIKIERSNGKQIFKTSYGIDPRDITQTNLEQSSETVNSVGIIYGMNIQSLFESWEQRHPNRSFQDFLDWIEFNVKKEEIHE